MTRSFSISVFTLSPAVLACCSPPLDEFHCLLGIDGCFKQPARPRVPVEDVRYRSVIKPPLLVRRGNLVAFLLRQRLESARKRSQVLRNEVPGQGGYLA